MVNDIMNSTLPELSEKDFTKNRPTVNIIEGKNDFRLEVAAPGLEKTDFGIHVEKDVLTISAKKEAKTLEDGVKYRHREFSFNEFKRTFRLPKNIDASKISADFNNGILTVTLPKKAEEAPRKIEIK